MTPTKRVKAQSTETEYNTSACACGKVVSRRLVLCKNTCPCTQMAMLSFGAHRLCSDGLMAFQGWCMVKEHCNNLDMRALASPLPIINYEPS